MTNQEMLKAVAKHSGKIMSAEPMIVLRDVERLLTQKDEERRAELRKLVEWVKQQKIVRERQGAADAGCLKCGFPNDAVRRCYCAHNTTLELLITHIHSLIGDVKETEGAIINTNE